MTSVNGRNRNGVFEIFKLIMLFWLALSHAFFISPSSITATGRVGAFFLFMLGGYFLLPNIKIVEDLPFFKGLGKLMLSNIKEFGVSFILSIFFGFIFLLMYDLFFVISFVLYLPAMLLCFALIFTLRKMVKSQKIFIPLLIVLAFACYILSCATILKDLIFFQAMSGVCIGTLLSLIKKIPLSVKPLIIAMVVIMSALALPIMVVLENSHLFCLVGFPLLIYFVGCLDYESDICDFIGSFSYGLLLNISILFVVFWRPIIENGMFVLVFFAVFLITPLTRLLDHTIKYILEDK